MIGTTDDQQQPMIGAARPNPKSPLRTVTTFFKLLWLPEKRKEGEGIYPLTFEALELNSPRTSNQDLCPRPRLNFPKAHWTY